MSLIAGVRTQWVGTHANAACLFALPFLAAAGGSASSILFFGCFIWNVAGLSLGKLKLPGERMVIWVAAVLFAYAALRGLSVFLSARPDFRTDNAIKPLAFIAFLPIVSALIHAPVANAVTLFQRGAATGAILGALQALIQIYGFAMARAEGFAGNPGPFSTVMILSGGIAATLAVSSRPRDRVLCYAGMAAGLVAAFLAGSKGVLPAVVAVGILSGAYLVREGALTLRLRTILAGAFAVALAVLVAMPVLNWRLTQLADDAANMEKGRMTRSIGSRLVMWEEGFSAFLEKPLFGHGYNLRTEAVRVAVENRTGSAPGSHLHNGFITDLVGNGLAGLITHLGALIAPFLLLRGARDRPATRLVRQMSIVVCATYLIADMSNLTFGHDILDSWYIFFLCLLAAVGINGAARPVTAAISDG